MRYLTSVQSANGVNLNHLAHNKEYFIYSFIYLVTNKTLYNMNKSC